MTAHLLVAIDELEDAVDRLDLLSLVAPAHLVDIERIKRNLELVRAEVEAV